MGMAAAAACCRYRADRARAEDIIDDFAENGGIVCDWISVGGIMTIIRDWITSDIDAVLATRAAILRESDQPVLVGIVVVIGVSVSFLATGRL